MPWFTLYQKFIFFSENRTNWNNVQDWYKMIQKFFPQFTVFSWIKYGRYLSYWLFEQITFFIDPEGAAIGYRRIHM